MARTSLSLIAGFDPRQAPVIGVDAHLPPVLAERMTRDALRARFAAPPVWQPEVVRERRFSDRASADAAVLVPIVARPRPTILLTQRTLHMSTHSGQVAFPGGKVDPEDASHAQAALREAREEVGLNPDLAEIIGTLPVYVTGTAFHVTPVVALVDAGMDLHPNPDEVADVFEVPLDFLMNPAHHHRHALEFEGEVREWFSMPYSDVEDRPFAQRERFIWGATAGMLRNLYRFLSA